MGRSSGLRFVLTFFLVDVVEQMDKSIPIETKDSAASWWLREELQDYAE